MPVADRFFAFKDEEGVAVDGLFTFGDGEDVAGDGRFMAGMTFKQQNKRIHWIPIMNIKGNILEIEYRNYNYSHKRHLRILHCGGPWRLCRPCMS